MVTKANPGDYDCYANALPDEPMFILLARDPYAPVGVFAWAADRQDKVRIGACPAEDLAKVAWARHCAEAMVKWRRENDGRWRKVRPSPHAFEEQFTGTSHANASMKSATPERIGAVSATINAPPRPNLAPGMWVHYKFNTVYELLNVALNEGTGEWMVVHLNRQTMNVFVRPASEWTEIVGTLDGREVPRFRAPDPGSSKGRE